MPDQLAHDQKYVGNALEPPLQPRACHYSYAIDTLLAYLTFLMALVVGRRL